MNEMAAVAPPDIQNPSPVDPSTDSSIAVSQPVDIHSMYEDAANTGDPVSMYSLTSRVKGTPYEEPIKTVAQTMSKNLNEFEKDVAPIVKAGGAQTPEGRIAAANTFQTIADKPQKMRAFVEMLMGNPNWRTFATGGTVKTTVGYDKAGNQLETQTNEIGQIVSVTDSATGKQLDRTQLASRGGLVPSLDHAIGYQIEKKNAEFNANANNAATAATNAYAAASDALKGKSQEIQQNLKNLFGSDLNDKQRDMIAQFTNRSIGYSQSISEGLNALTQKVQNKSANLSASQQKSLGSTMSALGWSMGADGNIKNSKGESVGKSDLDQAQSTLSNGSQFERGFNQSKKDFIENEVFKGLSGGEKELLGRTLDRIHEVERTQLELAAKHGSLPFMINPKTYEIGDQFKRGQASALINEFNADASKLFGSWRDQKMEAYRRTGTVPVAGQLEAMFVNDPSYIQLKKDFALKNKEINASPEPGRPVTEKTSPSSYGTELGVAPEQKPKTVQSRSVKNKPSLEDLANQYRR